MTMMTSAYANKVLRKLNDDKEFWIRKESEGTSYVAALDEEPIIPDYDYSKVAAEIAAIDERVIKIKHAINVANATNTVKVGDEEMTIDTILIKMAQLQRRKYFLDTLRKQEPKVRINSGSYSARKTTPEYRYINYDLDLIKSEYEKVDEKIALMQMALDKYNQTVEFEVED